MKITVRIEMDGRDEWTDETLGGQITHQVIEVTKEADSDFIWQIDHIASVLQCLISKLEVPRVFLLLAKMVQTFADCEPSEDDLDLPAALKLTSAAEDDMCKAASSVIDQWKDRDQLFFLNKGE